MTETSRIESAVLVPIFRDALGELRIVLVVRGARGLHGGQLALPGGKRDPGDRSLLDTALRETEEEIGLPRRKIEILAQLDTIDTRTTGFRVQPFLGRVHAPRQWRPAQGEITQVITPPVATLADPKARHERELSFPTWPRPRRVECVALVGDQLLWGLTLRLLDPLLPRLIANEWQV
jgi:8-oxo-dGTP pyrophosphatase MutT (NUDIX family)